MSVWQRRSDELAKLRATFPCGTLRQAQLAFTRATGLGATEAEVEQMVAQGITLMHRHRSAPVLVLPPTS